MQFAGAALIAIAVLVAYRPALRKAANSFSTTMRIFTNSPIIQASDGLYRIWCTTDSSDYYPVSNTSLWLEWRLWGTGRTGYHVTNSVLHISAALLIWASFENLPSPALRGGALVRGSSGERRVGGLDRAA